MRYNAESATIPTSGPKSPIHKYHTDIESIISSTLIGVVGSGGQIEAIITESGLTDAELSDLESWLGDSLTAQVQL